jgi:flagellar biosynthesis protein FlhG
MSRDQAEGLRRLRSPEASVPVAPRRRARVVAVTSGKGGVGKTSLAANLAVAAAARGRRVVLVDADLGLANADILLGLAPRATLAEVIAGQSDLRDVLTPAPGGVLLVPGANGIAELANLDPIDRQILLKSLTTLEHEADLIVVDTGAGLGASVTEFAAAADEVLVVVTPEPTSMTDAYAVVKTLVLGGRREGLRLAVNMSRSGQEALNVSHRLQSVCRRFLDSLDVEFAGAVPLDAAVAAAARDRRPFTLTRPQAPASRAVRQMAGRLLRASTHAAAVERSALIVHGDHRPRAGFFSRLGARLLGRTAGVAEVRRREAV